MAKKQPMVIKLKYFKLKLNPIIIGLVFVGCLLASLPFSSSLEVVFALRPQTYNINNAGLEVHFVNVGQGDAILVRLPNNETMLVDSGPSAAKDTLFYYIDNMFFKAGEKRVFDYVLLTHSDIDHSGNMLSVLQTYKVKTFYRPAIFTADEVIDAELYSNPKIVSGTYYNSFINKLNQLQSSGLTTVIISQAGITIQEQSINYLSFLSPNVNYYSATNNYSPVVMLEYNDKKIMLTGDAETLVETEVINNVSNLDNYLDVDVLKLAHHGSSTSTSINFLNIVKPEFAVISVGNEYGHPSSQVYDNLLEYGQEHDLDILSSTFTTYTQGNIIFYVTTSGELEYFAIQNINDYLFITWHTLVLYSTMSVLVVGMALAIKPLKVKASNI